MFSINADFNKIFKVIGYKTRTDILYEIARSDEMTLMKLSDKFNMRAQTLEFHIQKLKSAGLIRSKRKGNSLRLIFNRKKIDNAISSLQKVIG